MFKKKKKQQTQEAKTYPIVEIDGVKVEPVLRIEDEDGKVVTFYQMEVDQWLTTGRWMAATPYLKAKHLYNMTPEAFQAYEDELTDKMDDLETLVNEALISKSEKIRAQKLKLVNKRFSDIALHRANLRVALTLLDMPEVVYKIAVHALFLPGDDPSQTLNFEQQEKRIALLKKKNAALILRLPIIVELFELQDLLQTLSPDALEMRMKADSIVRQAMFSWLNDPKEKRENTNP